MNRCFRALVVAAVALSAPVALPGEPQQPDWLRTVMVSRDDPDKGLQVLSVCMTPGVTQSYEQIRIECIYRQEFDWTDSTGRTQRRVHEPVRFTYERENVRLTHDLDTHISFKVPIGVELLRSRFGTHSFRPDVPVAIPRIRIEARSGGEVLWAYEVSTAPGPQDLGDAHRVPVVPRSATPARRKPRGEQTPFGSVNLD